MQNDPQAILEAALQLPENQRVTLVARLLESLPAEDQSLTMDDPDLTEELDRRFADNHDTIPWSELKAED